MTGLRLPKGSSRTRNALTVEQVEALAAAVDPWWRPFLLVLAYCGLRPGEALALRRRHLDDLGRLTVERGMTEHRGVLLERGHEDTPVPGGRGAGLRLGRVADAC